jgi:hypothetical protein
MSRCLRQITFPSTLALGAWLLFCTVPAGAVDYPVTPGQRNTAQKVAEDGVPLSELAANAPDSYTVKRHDTLWDISKLYLKKPWRWPELWGMNLAQIRNPNLIYPGQVLYLDKSNGRARLRLAKPVNETIKLSPRVRDEPLKDGAISSIPMSAIGPFLNDARIFNANELEAAPRIVATQEGRVILSRGDTAYVRGNVDGTVNWQLFREPKPLKDPATGELLGFEARQVGSAELVAKGETRPVAKDKTEVVPATIQIVEVKEEAAVGDRLVPSEPKDFEPFAPHAPAGPISGQVISIYGDSINAGQSQIVSLNRGARDGLERGNVLALWHVGAHMVDPTDPAKTLMQLPDERQGLLFVFRVFDRVSYGLVMEVKNPIGPGDRFTQP